jgi:hypothetical protein
MSRPLPRTFLGVSTFEQLYFAASPIMVAANGRTSALKGHPFVAPHDLPPGLVTTQEKLPTR